VTDSTDTREVERSRDVGERVDSGRDVEEGRGPAATGAHPPVLEIPGSETALRQVVAQLGHERAVVACAPVAAVDDDDDRMRAAAALRKEELRDLAGIVAVPVNGSRTAHVRSSVILVRSNRPRLRSR
jgi:hypothetical protein